MAADGRRTQRETEAAKYKPRRVEPASVVAPRWRHQVRKRTLDVPWVTLQAEDSGCLPSVEERVRVLEDYTRELQFRAVRSRLNQRSRLYKG